MLNTHTKTRIAWTANQGPVYHGCAGCKPPTNMPDAAAGVVRTDRKAWRLWQHVASNSRCRSAESDWEVGPCQQSPRSLHAAFSSGRPRPRTTTRKDIRPSWIRSCTKELCAQASARAVPHETSIQKNGLLSISWPVPGLLDCSRLREA